MSVEYDKYINEHKRNVQFAIDWMKTYLPWLDQEALSKAELSIINHDESKYSDAEYDAYDKYFYGEKTEKVKENFDYAWNHHQKTNPHHWQYWVLINDDNKGDRALAMPLHYIYEMVADWWSFSISKDKPDEIFEWYMSHKDKMILHKKTKEAVEKILQAMAEKIMDDENKALFNFLSFLKKTTEKDTENDE